MGLHLLVRSWPHVFPMPSRHDVDAPSAVVTAWRSGSSNSTFQWGDAGSARLLPALDAKWLAHAPHPTRPRTSRGLLKLHASHSEVRVACRPGTSHRAMSDPGWKSRPIGYNQSAGAA